jgi:hypothetical protein
MKRSQSLLAAIALMMVLVTGALADPNQYLCIVEHSTGLHYDHQTKAWGPQAFAARKYILRRLTDDDRKGELQSFLQDDPKADWAFFEFGDKRPVSLCVEDKENFSMPNIVRCKGNNRDATFDKNLNRFEIIGGRYAYLAQGLREKERREDPEANKKLYKYDLYFEIGNCSPFSTSAVAENLVIDDPAIEYHYTFNTIRSHHFCDLATFISEAPIPISVKLTAAFVTDDAKPNDATAAYIVEAFLDGKDYKVIAARIISDIFNSDLHASKLVDKNPAATYAITSEGSLALFMNLMTISGKYTLAVEFENQSSLIVNVRPTADLVNQSMKWQKCGIAIMHRD